MDRIAETLMRFSASVGTKCFTTALDSTGQVEYQWVVKWMQLHIKDVGYRDRQGHDSTVTCVGVLLVG